MLILTRRTGERLLVTLQDGSTVKVVVLGVHGNQVRIGFDAPKDVEIHRKEIYERIRREVEGDADDDAAGNR